MSIGDGHTHHHGILAGLGAGTAAVLFAFGVVLLAWHRVAGQVSLAVTVVVWAVMFAVTGAVIAGFVYAVLWLRHRALHPETLAGRRAVTAEVLDTVSAPQAIPESRSAALEPPREVHNHFHFPDAGTAAAVVHAMRDREIQP